MRFGCIKVVLQYLTGEETRLYMCVGCIRVVVQYPQEKIIIDAIRLVLYYLTG